MSYAEFEDEQLVHLKYISYPIFALSFEVILLCRPSAKDHAVTIYLQGNNINSYS